MSGHCQNESGAKMRTGTCQGSLTFDVIALKTKNMTSKDILISKYSIYSLCTKTMVQYIGLFLFCYGKYICES